MKKSLLLLLAVLFSGIAGAQITYNTQPLKPNIKTLQIYIENQPLSRPVIELSGSDVLKIQFDEMSHNIRSYSYRVFQCNEDWTPSILNSNEYINGFDNNTINAYDLSVNTSYLYTHYHFSLPNENLTFTKSGNYVVQIYEDDNIENPVAQACFWVVEPRIQIKPSVTGNTDIELSKRLQQLEFEINLEGYTINNPQDELKIVVRQNNRTDNQVRGIKPTYYRGNTLSYINNRDLIFEGGNEFHRFDISSVYAGSQNISRIDFNRTYYDAYLFDDVVNTSTSYSSEPDVDGKYVINLQELHFTVETEADYVNVHFSIPKPEPFFDGQVYIGGELNYNMLNENSRMQYDFNSGRYFKSMLLKQGGYNYQYWFLQKNAQKASVERVDGSFWQTENEYAIYVYQREWGGRHDKLIGVKIFESN